MQKRMKDNKNRQRNRAKCPYLLSGMIECGAAYIGHTSTNGKGYQSRYYCCGNKYRTHTCKSKNINADELETFVVLQVKNFLLEMDYAETAEKYYKEISSASRDCKAERAELAEVEKKIANGLKAVMTGLDIPELHDEIERLRDKKLELENIIETNKSVPVPSKEDIEKALRQSVEGFDPDHMRRSIEKFVQKIYANTDGTCTVHVGVHSIGCGGRI